MRGISIVIDCDDLAACREFYVGVLGFEPLSELGPPDGIALGWPASPEAGQIRLRAKDSTRMGNGSADPEIGLAVEVMNVDHAYHTAHTRGHPITESLRDSGGDRRFTVIDPQGVSVEVYTRPGSPRGGSPGQDRSAWQILADETDLRWPYAVRVAATLRLTDRIAAGVNDVDELAAQAGADPDALGRLLRYLACRGVFREAGPGRFEVTELGALLNDDHPSHLRAWLDLEGAGGRMDQTFSSLLDVVRTGEPAYPGKFGHSLWEDLKSSPGLATSFNGLMAGHSERFAPEVVGCCDWAGVRVAVDVGGGTGVLLAEVLRANPQMQGILVDQESPAAAARQRFLAAELGERGQVVVGSFFEPLPRAGDVYLLSRILHDWNDGAAIRLLRNCAQAGGPTARVVVIETATPEGAPLQRLTARDLRMLAVYGGRERTAAEIDEIAAQAGLTTSSVNQTPSGLSVIDLRRL